MSDIILASSIRTYLPVPQPKETINIRPGTVDDIPFIDQLQKKYSKNLAFLPKKALEGKIAKNEVLIAESSNQGPSPKPQPLGYLIGQDRYFKRDEVGIIYHLAVEESQQRGFIGAALLKAQFERSAYGCKLYCCWCAQDLAANHFYEAMGFIPLAFRAGSEKKNRIHIFWEKRIREGDTITPWWFPSETKGGLMQADRIAFPIPPDRHWSDELPLILPGNQEETKLIESPATQPKRVSKPKQEVQIEKPKLKVLCGLTFQAPQSLTKKKEKQPRAKTPKAKINPIQSSQAREFKDRWLEVVNHNPNVLAGIGKYDLTRQIESIRSTHPLLLEAT